MRERFLQVFGRIEVVLKKKLHGPFSSFTALSHITSWPQNGEFKRKLSPGHGSPKPFGVTLRTRLSSSI